jgi:predicted Zn-dependent protease
LLASSPCAQAQTQAVAQRDELFLSSRVGELEFAIENSLATGMQILERKDEGKRHPGKLRRRYDISFLGKRSVGRGLNLYSPEAEMALGAKLAAQIERRTDPITDSAITEYVARIEQAISKNSDTNARVVVRIVIDRNANAYSLPGGFVYVNTGLILAAENEAELAAALAHETAHIAARHTTKLATKARIWRWAFLPGGYAGIAIGKLVTPLFLRKWSRDAELDADLLGLEYQYSSGYDPNEFVRLLSSIRGVEGRHVSFFARLFDEYPLTKTRIKHLQKAIIRYLPPRGDYVTDTSEFQDVKLRLAEVIRQEESANELLWF